MNIRTHLFNLIEDKLSTLAYRIELRGKLNVLDFHLHSENFYLHFFNELFGWQLKNMNTIKHNIEAIDLIDNNNQVIIQVSSTATKAKINSALSKDLSMYNGYSFKFISISRDASELRTKTYDTPHYITFDPISDIYDVKTILDTIIVLDIENLGRIYNFIKKELRSDIDVSSIDTNLASIINILAQEDWDKEIENCEIKPFEIERKIEFNNLITSKAIIDDYKIHSNRIDKIFTEFNKLGANKSYSVLSYIRQEYIKNKKTLSDDILFFKVIELVIEKIQESTNYKPIPYDELELCVSIFIVDAFIRCKIFENPEGYVYVTPR